MHQNDRIDAWTGLNPTKKAEHRRDIQGSPERLMQVLCCSICGYGTTNVCALPASRNELGEISQNIS